MREILSDAETAICWEAAINGELGKLIKKTRGRPFPHLLGKVLEGLGQTMFNRRFPEPSYLVMAPDIVERDLRGLITLENQRSWQLGFPDGILFQRIDDQGSLKMLALVEYKIAHPQHLDDLSIQFNGFMNFWDYLMQNDGATGKGLLRKYFNRKFPKFTSVEYPLIYYFVPLDRSGLNIATTLGGLDCFYEMVIPLTVKQIGRRIRNIKR